MNINKMSFEKIKRLIFKFTVVFLVLQINIASILMFSPDSVKALSPPSPESQIVRDSRIHLVTTKEEFHWGTTVPIIVAVTDTDDIDRVVLKVRDDPGTRITHLKTIYENQRKDRSFYFTYFWDTFEAQTTPDTTNRGHLITVEGYKKSGNSYIFQGKTTGFIKVTRDKNYRQYNPLNDGFWGGYLDNNKSLDDYWNSKLNCGQGGCNSKEQIVEKISTTIRNGDFSDEDFYQILDGYERFTVRVNSNPLPDENTAAEETAQLIFMGDFVQFLNEKMAEKDGFNAAFHPSLTMIPDPTKFLATFINHMPILQSLPLMNDREEFVRHPDVKKLVNKMIAEQPKDPRVWQDLKEEYEKNYPGLVKKEKNFKIPKVKAALPVLAIVAVVGMAAWCGYDIYKDPSPGNIALQIGIIGATLATGGGGTLAKIPVIGPGFAKIGASKAGVAFRTAGSWLGNTRAGKFLSGLWAKYGAPVGAKIAGWLAPVGAKASSFWFSLPPWLRNFLWKAGLLTGAAWLLTSLTRPSQIKECMEACTGKGDAQAFFDFLTAGALAWGGMKLLGPKFQWTGAALGIMFAHKAGFSPLADPLCFVACWIMELMGNLFDWAMAIFESSMGISLNINKPSFLTCNYW